MGYFEGFGVTIRQHRLFGGKRVTTKYSGGRTARRHTRPRRVGPHRPGRQLAEETKPQQVPSAVQRQPEIDPATVCRLLPR